MPSFVITMVIILAASTATKGSQKHLSGRSKAPRFNPKLGNIVKNTSDYNTEKRSTLTSSNLANKKADKIHASKLLDDKYTANITTDMDNLANTNVSTYAPGLIQVRLRNSTPKRFPFSQGKGPGINRKISKLRVDDITLMATPIGISNTTSGLSTSLRLKNTFLAPTNQTANLQLLPRLAADNVPYVSGHIAKRIIQNKTIRNTGKCILKVSDQSIKYFTIMILRYRYNFVYMHLRFNDLNVTENEIAIDAKHWIWTYKGKSGGHQLLYLPQDFGYLSLGILWSNTMMNEMYINIHKHIDSGDCDNLTIGQPETDLAIGYALGNMTVRIADRNDMYNSSFWCYNQRFILQPGWLFSACENSICTIQTFAYRCCRYWIDFMTAERDVGCPDDDYHFGTSWWALPIIIGETCFAFYPIFLTTIGSRLSKTERSRRNRQTEQGNTEERQGQPKFIRLGHTYPVSFVSTLFAPLVNKCNFNGSVRSRLLRTLIILLPMTLSTVRVYFDYKYSSRLITEAVTKGGLVGFSSLIAGPEKSRKYFLYILGGPYIALPLYLFFGSLFILVPTNIQDVLVKGLYDSTQQQKFLFLMPLVMKEKFSRISVQKHGGFKKIHNYLLANFYMVLNQQFWRYCICLLIQRWREFSAQIRGLLAHLLLYLCILPLYIAFCFLELLLTFLIFTFPVVSCFFIFLKAYIVFTLNKLRVRSFILNIMRPTFIVLMTIAFVITWYMYCIIFFDGFWLLSKVVMFTYTGIIAYPKLSYGYLILSFMTLFYLMESINTFGLIYRDLLKLSIAVYEKMDTLHDPTTPHRRRNGIPVKLFETIIEQCMSKRIQVFFTIFKVVGIVVILSVSIDLLLTFDKLEDLSLVSHVFTVLFICALPKILKSICIDKRRRSNKKTLQKKIHRIVKEYLENEAEDLSFGDEELSFPSRYGYERINVESD